VSRWGDIYRGQVACPLAAFTPEITDQVDTLCASGTGSFQWYRNGELLADTTACIAALEEGSYTVVVTDGFGCVSNTSAPVQVIHTGIAVPAENRSFRLVPNPASGVVRVERAEGTAAWLTVLDVQGRAVLETQITGPSTMLDVSGLKSGVYVVRVAAPEAVEVGRLVVE
ncbi:MAG: T9SS type A sorting domain-containing protein, partial [Bacteroidetes bacterium]|nr:T9SS type A sorting domain-containing protein [Bacteroidota bacterium]